jgi:hypothetical protein
LSQGDYFPLFADFKREQDMKNEKLLEEIDERIKEFHGDFGELTRAVGTYVVARHYGWKVLFLMQDKKTIKKHEKILGINFREVLAEEGVLADNSKAWRLVKKAGQFWKTVKGEIKGVRSREIDGQGKLQ